MSASAGASPSAGAETSHAGGGTAEARPLSTPQWNFSQYPLVTVGEYARCVEARECSLPGTIQEGTPIPRNYVRMPEGYFSQAARQSPIRWVSFVQATAYCRARGMHVPSAAEHNLAFRRDATTGESQEWLLDWYVRWEPEDVLEGRISARKVGPAGHGAMPAVGFADVGFRCLPGPEPDIGEKAFITATPTSTEPVETSFNLRRPARSRRDVSVVTLGKARIHGQLDPAGIEETLRRHLGTMHACYERERLRTPALTGRMVVVFDVSANGEVTTARIRQSTLRNAAAEGCLSRQFRKMRFHRTGDGLRAQIELLVLFHVQTAD